MSPATPRHPLVAAVASLSPSPPSPPVTAPPPPSAWSSLHSAASSKADLYFALGLPDTASFFADKAATFSSSASDVLRLARHFSCSGHHRRALHLLQSRRLHETNAPARLLCAQSLFALGHLDDCLATLGGDDPAIPFPASPGHDDVIDTALEGLSIDGDHAALGCEIRAAFCVLRARVYETMENANRAALWYKRALTCDIYCTEAFERLTLSGLVTHEDAFGFVTDVTNFSGREQPPGELDHWLLGYFRASMDSSLPLPSVPSGEKNVDVLCVKARRLYDLLDFSECASICRDILKADPYVGGAVLETYLAALVELDERHELFVTAHGLVERAPKSGVSWMAVGYYYFACGKPEMARRYLQKATTLEGRLGAAWVAFGHAFGAQDESDQAMAAYRTASRLFPGAQLPMLFMGMEYARQSSLGHATRLFRGAAEACPGDPGPRHELGVVAYRVGDMAGAVGHFKGALALWEAGERSGEMGGWSGRRAEAEEATLFNLGHCYRRLREFEQAKICYERALGLRPQAGSTCTALGITLHAMGDVGGAVGMYHRALRFCPDDATCGELLERALGDMFMEEASKLQAGVGLYAV